jgi:2-phosphoglycerate kinase
MAKKPLVIDSATGQEVPFLRGVLVQSLVAVGLSFTEAYGVAQRVRELLDASADTCDTARLRKLVADEIERRFDKKRRRAYEIGKERDRPPLVTKAGRNEQFSVDVLSRHLEGCGVRHEEALEVARLVQESLRQRGRRTIDRSGLRRVVYDTLRASCSADAADRFLSRCRFKDSGEPLILLIGGATGAGKSTVAARIAYLFDIVRTQSTDMMREIIRCYLVPHVAPTLGFSSFDAWQGLPEIDPVHGQTRRDSPVVSGFLAQFDTVKVALEATIERAVMERNDLIVDGVHILPSGLELSAIRDRAVVVALMLAVSTRERLDDQLKSRSREQPQRDAQHQREALERIWELQGFMVDQAEKADVPVIASRDLDEALEQVIDEIMRRIIQRFPPDLSVLGGSGTPAKPG